MSSTDPFSAARVGDGIEHTACKGWLVVGVIGGGAGQYVMGAKT